MPRCALGDGRKVWWVEDRPHADSVIVVRLGSQYTGKTFRFIFKQEYVNRNGVIEYVLADIEQESFGA